MAFLATDTAGALEDARVGAFGFAMAVYREYRKSEIT